MKNLLEKKIKTILLLLAFTTVVNHSYSQGHEIKVKINGVKDTLCYLANYYGPKQYYKDTTEVDSQGNMVFNGKSELPGGIYSVVLPDKQTYFEFIVTEQKFSLETTKGDQATLNKNMKVKNSEENKLFFEYLQFINAKQLLAEPWRKILQDTTGVKTPEKEKEAKDELNKIDEEVKAYKSKFMQTNANSFVSKIFKASEEPEIPETPILENGRKDSLFPRYYYMSHYWDGIDFSDDRLLRTPIFHGKLERYFEKIVVQHPDSIKKAADVVVEKARANKEMFKYVVHYVTNTYEKSNLMGMDAVFVHMGETYYTKEQAFWVDSTQLAKVAERVRKTSPTLLGKRTPNVILQDTSESKWVNLYNLEAPYTILYFWDPGCGHCKKETPKLKALYDKTKSQGVEVFAVCTDFETAEWKKYVIENELNWINVSDNPEINKNAVKYLHITTLESLNFRDTYDIYSTPRVFLLDKDKKILAKRLSVEQLEELLDIKLKEKK